jgi:phosphoribosylformimino-5-aminoimidazole carboxamide ribotide isomerase
VLKRYHGAEEGATARRAGFAILPAIDLVAGRVVRLAQGDFARTTIFAEEPAAVAAAFANAGAPWLHVVDLDGARAGTPEQLDAVARVVGAAGEGTRVEAAGGLRTDEAVDAAVAAGAHRVVLGTAALRDPGFAARTVARLGPDAVAVAIDVRDGDALGEGWRTGAPSLPAETAVEQLAAAGVTTFEVTAIERDGLLGGPDLGLLERIVRLGAGDVIASGGIGRLDDLRAVQELGCAGAIVGRALYEGRFTVEEALAAVTA